jgi:lipopolysaccharide O-acetyltransferase
MMDIHLFGTLKKYGIFGSIRLLIDFFFTKVYFSSALLIRRPFYYRNIGKLIGGRGMIAGPNMILDILDSNAVLEIGKNFCVNHAVHIAAVNRVVIGDDVLLASRVYISDHSHGNYKNNGSSQDSPNTPPNSRSIISSPISIGDRCWLGEGVCVLPGSHIGAGSIIGANSVVTGFIPENSIAVGSPAKVIKKWSSEEMVWINV